MSALLRAFYSLVLWVVRLELAIALSAPERNRQHIAALQSDESNYESALIRLEFGL